MKSNKVLLGLFVGVFALVGGPLKAQSTFHELGPVNVGGQVSSIVVDQRDTNHTTIYAGAISGGLFVRSENEDLLSQMYTNAGLDATLAENHNIWHIVPSNELLPITSMVQGPDNTIYIGTGDNTFQVGSMFGRMSVLGKGIYRYNPEQGTMTLVPGTKPTALDDDFAAVKQVDYVYYNGKLYFYAITSTGIYRWVISSEADWATAQPTEIYEGEVGDFLMVRARRMAYFSDGNQLYKIGDVTKTNMTDPINISSSNSAFAYPNGSIKLATSVSDPSYLYAMVIDTLGMMSCLYMTTNEQDWTTLTTSTVTPMTAGTGLNSGTIVVDPTNPRRVIIAGSTIWIGEGFVEGGYFQWSKSSYSEDELNYGDYMSSVYSSNAFVHSHIHQIVPTWQNNEQMMYYIATDGGVFCTEQFASYENINLGLNNLQINDLAVCPDGSVVSGAVANASQMLESRLAHNSIASEPTWYDEEGQYNHYANVIFSGTGGRVAASMFQQVKPQSRRTIMVSNSDGNYGRAYADYLDYTNTQTWTQGPSLVSNWNYYGGNNVMGNMLLWETTNNTLFNDSVHFNIDTLSYVMRKNTSTNEYDTVWFSLPGQTTGGVIVRDENGRPIDTTAVGSGWGSKFRILVGDKIMITSRANSEYPFEHTFTKAQYSGDQVVVRNPLQARTLIIARDSNISTTWTVQLSLRATDFTKVWNGQQFYDNNAYDHSGLCLWYPLFEVRTHMAAEKNYRPRALAMSADGTKVFIAVNDISTNKSMIVRLKGFENINYFVRNTSANTRKQDYTRLRQQLAGPRGNSASLLTIDTLKVDGNVWIPRSISSLTIDSISSTERLLVTFEDYNSEYDNFAIVDNCKTDSWALETVTITGHSGVPAFCSMIERTTGDIYVGTSDGAFFRHGNTWAPYENLQGVPVTAMKQQQASLPIQHTMSHNGITPVKYAFAKTKWPNAMYFGTYGRGIFMDMQYVTDTTNEVVDSVDNLGIPTVHNTSMGSVSVYPNPVVGQANLKIVSDMAGNAVVRIYDLNGRLVVNRNLGIVSEGEQTISISTEGLSKGMYLVNVIIGGYTSATKMMVR